MGKFMKLSSLALLAFVLLFSFDSSKALSISLPVSQAIQQQNNSIKTVEGYIVGKPVSSTSVITNNYPDDYSLAIADSSMETNTSNMLYVQLPSQFRSQFGLKSNPELKGEKIKVTGNLTAYYSHPGLKNTTEMILLSSDGETGDGSDEGGYTGSYYDPAIGKSGEELKAALHNIIDDHTEISYSSVWEALKQTDADPNNSNNVILLYTGRSQSKSSNGSGVDNWNREHVWAKSHGNFGTAMGPGTDLHHLRPTDVSVNSSRGNKDFDNGGSPQGEAPDTFTDNDSWEPHDEVKGDVARMIFYMDVRYEGDRGELDLEVNNVVNNGTTPYHGKLSTLIQWHHQDPVDNFERQRNESIYNDYQHNRNPFIDHPEWVEAIWN
ncbi:endonuclease [Cytobacillus horneckiae]|uniref:Ribonuclease n=1 Tax=Cytobacillus horneckiae TaxID=549687 RepID=A0A2N0ZJ71_9BACI|nr:endonuclease [Cytobacillus horneckiae]MEC1153936.1 endonuclease [Cytobacillus horneckiae]MED2938511.1 endonuclease [Cytobacillus horneckiae]PKG29565.1 ribonuclease [Cytobacillus horneckiae]